MSYLPRCLRTPTTTALLLSVMPLIIGCGSALRPTVIPAPEPSSPLTSGAIAGMVHGGNQPIIGASVDLYSVGTSGYGSVGTHLATTSSQAPGGSFSFTQSSTGTAGPTSPISATYTCPSSTTQVYMVVRGGSTQGVGNGTNSAAAFAVAIGQCGASGSTYTNVNEVTSVATMAALQQYFNPVNETFGYPNTTQATQGFANGVSTISNLANLSKGAAVTSTPYSATPLGASNSITVTVTPEVNKINSVADILAACVNNTSNTASSCTTLFADAIPPTAAFTSQPSQVFTSITASTEDTLQALYFMMTNPDSGGVAANMNGLFNLTSTVAPFQPVYATAPTDWTIAINYSSSSACTNSAGNLSTEKFLNGVNNPTIDASGNIWGASIAATGDLFEIAPTGLPMTCGLGSLANTASSLTIDPNGYLWVSSNALVSSYYHLYKWNPTTGALDSTWQTSKTAPTQTLVADGNNNILYTATTNTSTFDTTSGSLNEFAGAGAVGTSNTGTSAITTQAIAILYSNPEWLAVDSSDRAWIAISHVGTPTSEGFFDVYPSNNTAGSTYMAGTSDGLHTGFETANVATAISGGMGTYSPYGVAVGENTVDSANGAGSGNLKGSYQWQLFTPGSTAGTASAQDVAQEVGGLVTPRGIAVDGASNVFSADDNTATGNYVTGATTSGEYMVGEISSTGVAIASSANSGYGGVTGAYQKDPSMLPAGPRGIAVDPTGNVWVGINSSTATSIMELVGVGVPVVTPLSVAAQKSELGQMP
jgi:hypothetical protein